MPHLGVHSNADARRHFWEGWRRSKSPGWRGRTRRFADDRETSETALSLSSLPADAPTIAHAIRQHWGVENQCPWCLDVIFREDACRARTRNAAQNLSVLRVCLLNLLRRHKTPADSFRRMIMHAALDPTYLETLLELRQN